MADGEAKEGELIDPESVEVIRQGKEIILPVGMSYDNGIKWLKRRRDEDAQEVSIVRTFPFFPSEGALALTKVMAERYGWVKAKVIPMMFGSRPPELIPVETRYGHTEQVPFGRFEIPNVNGYVQCGVKQRNALPCFTMAALTSQAHRHEVTQLFDHVERVGLAETPYRGAAIRLPYGVESEEMEDYFPKFIDIQSADVNQMVFSSGIENLLMDNVFGPVMHTEQFRSRKIPLKMGVLLEGDYGCGKTLVANALAKVCTENGWTYVLCEDPADLARCVAVARRFEPAVVFCEDIDREVSGQRRTKGMDKILNTIDGIESKGTEIMVVLTTNHVDELTPAMRRPGRLDVVVPITAPDAEAVGRMLTLYAGDEMDTETNLGEVSELLSGRTPAVIREVVERSKRSAIVMADDDGKPIRLTGDAMVRAAQGMQRHLELLEPSEPDALEPLREIAAAMDRRTQAEFEE